MSGKYANKKRKNRKKKNLPVLTAIVIVCVILAGLVVFAVGLDRSTDMPEPTMEVTEDPMQTVETVPSVESEPEVPATDAATEPTVAATEEETEPSEPEEPYLFDLGNGIKIVGMIPYTGAFMEDRTDEVVTDVLGIQIKNTGDEYIQTMDITLTAGETQAQFSLSTLFPGESVVVLEKNRMAYSTAPTFEQAQTSSVSRFEAHPGMCEEKLRIQCLNGVINITNISEEDITGDIFVYYKNYVGGVYYGGLTYRIRLEGGLKAGQIHQGTAAHFNPDNSAVVFVTCG